MKITIQLTSQSFPCTIDPEDTLEHLRSKVQDRSGIPSNRQRLIWQGQALTENEQTIEEYGIKDGDTISMKIMLSDAVGRPPSDYDQALKGLLGTHRLPSWEAEKALLQKMVERIQIPGEEITLDSLKDADGTVKKPCHFCRLCEVTFGHEDPEQEAIIDLNKLIRFSACLLSDKSHIYHMHCAMIKICKGLYQLEHSNVVTWTVAPGIVSKNFACDKATKKLVCRKPTCNLCNQLEIKKQGNNVTSSVTEEGLPAETLPWLSGWEMQGSAIIRPHFREQDLPYILPLFQDGDLIDCYGYRAALMFVKMPAEQNENPDKKRKRDEEEGENEKGKAKQEESKGKEKQAESDGKEKSKTDKEKAEAWRTQVIRLETDDWRRGIIPQRVIDTFGADRYRDHPVYERAISEENFDDEDEDDDDEQSEHA